MAASSEWRRVRRGKGGEWKTGAHQTDRRFESIRLDSIPLSNSNIAAEALNVFKLDEGGSEGGR